MACLQSKFQLAFHTQHCSKNSSIENESLNTGLTSRSLLTCGFGRCQGYQTHSPGTTSRGCSFPPKILYPLVIWASLNYSFRFPSFWIFQIASGGRGKICHWITQSKKITLIMCTFVNRSRTFEEIRESFKWFTSQDALNYFYNNYYSFLFGPRP